MRASKEPAVIRKTLNASRLRDEVSRRIHRIHEIVEDGVKISVPRPHKQEPDASGCNWTMKHFGNAVGYERFVAEVLKAVRSEYNLFDDSEAKDVRDPFGG
nr:hypothetical protein [Paraburkholderia sp. NMBU_R16]